MTVPTVDQVAVPQHRENVIVGKTGFEPATPCSQSRCATKLRHFPDQGQATEPLPNPCTTSVNYNSWSILDRDSLSWAAVLGCPRFGLHLATWTGVEQFDEAVAADLEHLRCKHLARTATDALVDFECYLHIVLLAVMSGCILPGSEPSSHNQAAEAHLQISQYARHPTSTKTWGGTVHIGVMMFPTDKAIQPIELAKASEERGFESLWFPEHSHIPTSRVTPWGGREGAPPLPDEYWRSHDQFVALAAAAAVTENINIGTGITLVAQRDPLWLAKEIGSLDTISNGRFIFGIGYGWNKEELSHHGVKYTDRRAVVRENILAMKEIWNNDEAEFHGDWVDFSSSWSWPKPVQAGGPKVILGGSAGPRTNKDIAEFCDGWMPTAGRYDIAPMITDIRQAAEDIGRDPNELEFGQFGTPGKPEIIEQLAEAGATRVVLGLPPAPADTVLPILDSYAELL